MAIAGTLEIQMLANIARLQSDMNQAKSAVTNATAHIERAVSSAKTALASLGITLGAAAFVAMIKGSIDAADHLNDLSKSTALTIEQLAGLRIAAKQSGADLDGVAGSITKLAQNMGKDVEKFRQAGITARDPLEAFKQLADMFVAIEDPQTRAALGAATLGKNWATAAPLLAEGGKAIGEMIDKGTRLSGVTTELAKQADAFNDKLVLLTGTNSIMNSVTGQLLPLLNKLAGDMLEAKEKSGGVNDGFTILLDTFKLAVILGGMVAKTFQAIGTAAGAQAAQLAALAHADFAGAMLIRKEALADLAKMPGDFLKWRDSILAVGTAAQVAASKLDAMDQVSRRMASAAAAEARKASADAEKRARGLIGGDGAGREKKVIDEIAAHNKRMRELDLKGWVAYAEERERIDIEELKENARRWAEHWKEMEKLRDADIAGALDAFDKMTDATEELMRAEAALVPSMTEASDAAKKMMTEYLDPAKAKSFGDALSAAFGSAGSALGKLINSLEDYGRKMAEIEKMRATNAKINDPAIRAANEIALAKQSALAQISAYGDMAAAAKGFFETGSSGYKALEAAERVFRAFELASAIQTMLAKSGLLTAFTGLFVASKATETAATVASVAPDVAASMAKGQAAALVGVANQAQGDPYSAWARMAAMAAVMVGLGFAVSSSFGGGGGGQTAAQRQREQGTGTVLGDADAKSQSLLNSLREIEKTDKLGLVYSHDMLEALRAIQGAMSGLATAIFRTTGMITGANSGVETGTVRNQGSLLLGALGIDDSWFMKWQNTVTQGLAGWFVGLIGKTTTEITDTGLRLYGRLAEMIKGEKIDQYTMTRTQTSYLGGLINGKPKDGQVNTPVDDIARQLGLVFKGITDSVEGAAKALGMWTPYFHDAMLNIMLTINTVSFKDLKGQELTDALNAVLSAASDQIAHTMLPGFEEFQKVGEGYYETLIRVATGNEYVKQTFAALGLDLPLVGMAAVTARMDLIDLVGGLESFGKLTQDYYSKYYTPAEQHANLGANLSTEFSRLGVAMPTDTDGFRRMVEGIDLGTEAGRKLWAEMMKLAPSFYDFATQVVGLDGALHSLDDVTAQHRSLEEEYAVLTGQRTAQSIEREHRMAEAIDNTSLAQLQAIFVEEDRQAGLERQARQNEARFDLETQLFNLTHSEAEILERNRSLKMSELALKEQELGMAPGTLQAIQRQIDAQTDLNAAREAEKAALKTTSDLEGRLGVLRGTFTQKELDRAREWQAAASDTDRALLSQIYAEEDLAEATRKTTEALDEATSSQQSMWDRFATDAQKMERDTRIVNEGFAALGLAVPPTRQAFADLVAGIDPTTTAGQALLAALEPIAPSFDNITSAALTMVGALYGATPAGTAPPGAVWVTLPDGTGYWMVPPGAGGADGTDAANIARQRRQLEIELMEALGHAEEALAAKRADILADLDASLHDLQQQVWDALDAQKLREAAEAWTGVLNDWLNSNALSDLSPMTAQQQLEEARRQYDLAKLGGDAGALTAAADMLLAADRAVEGFGGGYSALYAQIRDDLSGLAESGPVATVGEAQIVTAVGELRQEVADAKAETARLLERLIEATRDGTDTVAGAVNTGTTKTASATEKAAAIGERR